MERGHDVTLFATADSVTTARLEAVAPRLFRGPDARPQGRGGLHIAPGSSGRTVRHDPQRLRFPATHLHGLVDTPVITTIHGFSSPRSCPCTPVRHPALRRHQRRRPPPVLPYLATIHHGIRVGEFAVHPRPADTPSFSVASTPTRASRPRSRSHGGRTTTRHRRDHPGRAVLPRPDRPIIDDEDVRFIGPVGPPSGRCARKRAVALLHLIDFDEPFGSPSWSRWRVAHRSSPPPGARWAS